MSTPVGLDALWAKSSPTGGLPVMRHMADVAAVAHALFDTFPDRRKNLVAAALGLAAEQASGWISAIAGAHDVGKATPGFQSKWEQGKRSALAAGFDFPVAAPDRHDASSQVILKLFLTTKGVARVDAEDLSSAAGAHHGFRIEATDLIAHARFPLSQTWKGAHRQLLEILIEITGAHGIPTLPTDPGERGALLAWLSGLCSVADWIGSSESYFSHNRTRGPYGSWFVEARHLAQKAVSDCGLAASRRGEQRHISRDEAVGLALGADMKPRPLQDAVGGLLGSAAAGPALFVIEAPMGEGKTEAALSIDAWFRSNAGSRGLYLAMPTQATSNALFERVARYLGRTTPSDPIELHLAHSGAGGNAASLRLREIGYGSSDVSVRASDWLAGPKRTMLSPNAIGTVDQALVGVLNAKHHFVRLHGLADRVVVLDEVHAYDAYTGGLIERLVSWLKSQGCTVVIMSATLPVARRNAILAAWGAGPPPKVAYPRVTMADAIHQQAMTAPSSRQWQVEIGVAGEAVEDVAASAVAAAARDAAVLVVANKVDRAQQIYEIVKRQTKRSMLFHARFPLEERLAIERKMLARFGKDGTDRQGFVVVATQVAEQSLDVDFDFLVTDLAPVDLLMQRIGRVHRHIRTRPSGFAAPRVLVSGLRENEALELRLTSRIYSALPVLRTVAWLADRLTLSLPADIDVAVQWVYADEAPSAVSPPMQAALGRAADEFAAEQERHEQLARLASLPAPSEWRTGAQSQQIRDDDASEGQIRFGTRLGEDSALAVPIFRLEGGYSVLGDGADWGLGEPIPGHAARHLARRTIRISNRRLLAILRGQAALSGWGNAPGISHALPLVLDPVGHLLASGLSARLDPELGLVIGQKLDEDRLPHSRPDASIRSDRGALDSSA
jgi:CRISPR-associated endonuclease/helicase Cas3